MPLTTDVYGPSEQETRERFKLLQEQTRGEALRDVARTQAQAQIPRKTPGMPTPTGVAQRKFAEATYRGAELGEPTSFQGGAGAPEPIAVMRGTTTTYSPGRIPGRQFAEPEYSTPLQAQQAYNRGMLQQSMGRIAERSEREKLTRPALSEAAEARYGAYRAPGQTIAEIQKQETPALKEQRLAYAHSLETTANAADMAIKQAQGGSKRQEANELIRNIVGSWGGKVSYKENALGYDMEFPKDENVLAALNTAHEVAMREGGEAGKRAFADSMLKALEPMLTPNQRKLFQEYPEVGRQFIWEEGADMAKKVQQRRREDVKGRETFEFPAHGTLGLESRQYGGAVEENRPYLVGEGGPEVIVPRQPGTVIPNFTPQTDFTPAANFGTEPMPTAPTLAMVAPAAAPPVGYTEPMKKLGRPGFYTEEETLRRDLLSR